MAYIRYRSQTVAIEVFFPFNFAVVFYFIRFRSRPSKPEQAAVLGRLSLSMCLWYGAQVDPGDGQ